MVFTYSLDELHREEWVLVQLNVSDHRGEEAVRPTETGIEAAPPLMSPPRLLLPALHSPHLKSPPLLSPLRCPNIRRTSGRSKETKDRHPEYALKNKLPKLLSF